MFRRWWIGALVLVLVGLWGFSSADARRKHRHGQRHKHTISHKAEKPTHKTTAKLEPAKKSNMPVGWTWPPSPEMQAFGQECLADLDHLGVKWTAAPPVPTINTPIVVNDMMFGGLKVMRTRSKGSLVMDCALARGLARDAAPVLASLSVHELHVGQIHGFREVAGKPGVLSRHSLGLAMDIYSFVTDDGKEHIVEHGYLAGDVTLRVAEILLGRTGAFRTLLTPGNDPGPHYNHFHLEARAFNDKVVAHMVRGAGSGWCDVVGALGAGGLSLLAVANLCASST
jgi:hypothetical protein